MKTIDCVVLSLLETKASKTTNPIEHCMIPTTLKRLIQETTCSRIGKKRRETAKSTRLGFVSSSARN